MPISKQPLNSKQRKIAKKGFSKQCKSVKKTGDWGTWKNESHVLHGSFGVCRKGKLLENVTEFWVNDYVSVQIAKVCTTIGNVKRLGIRRNDESANISWSEKQRIKNELCGKESVAIEVFPSDSDLVNEANMFWLWVLPPDYKLPFSL